MKLHVIATYPTSHDAELHKVRLEQAGIKAYVDGSAAADTLSLGTFLGGVKLLVADIDVAKARGALNSIDDEESPTPAWTCSECGTEIEAGNEVCWSCGHTIDGEETFPAEPEPTGDLEHIACPMCGENITAPPYQCPACGEVARDVEEEPTDAIADEGELDAAEEEAEKYLRLGYRSSIIGLVFMFCLPVVQIYSLLQLYRYMKLCDENNANANWRAWVAFALNIGAMFFFVQFAKFAGTMP